MDEPLTKLHPAVAEVIARAEPILHEYGYAGVFVCNFLEGMGVPVPGQSVLMAGSLLAGHGEFSIELLVLAALVAVIGGSCVGYWIGRMGGRAVLLRLPLSTQKLERVEGFFVRHGILVVLLARFVDGFRQTTPILAGSLKMPWWRFFGATAAGAIAWVAVWGIGVYYLGRDVHQVLALLHQLAAYGWWIAGLLLLLLAVWLLVRERRR